MTVALALTVIVFLAGLTPFSEKIRPLLPACLRSSGHHCRARLVFSLLAFLKQKEPKGILRYSPTLLAAAVIGTQMALSLSTFPYYFNYYNPLVGGSRARLGGHADRVGRRAGQARPLPEPETGRSKTEGYCMVPNRLLLLYFRREGAQLQLWTGINEDEWNRFFESDYAVIYIGQQQRQLTKPILDYLAEQEPEHTVLLNGIEYARIYKVHQ